MSDFRVAPYERAGSFRSCWTPPGSPEYHVDVNIVVGGMPPSPGQIGPGITLKATTVEELHLLHAWVIAKLSAP